MSIVREKALAALQAEKQAEEAARVEKQQREQERAEREQQHVRAALGRTLVGSPEYDAPSHPLRVWFGTGVEWEMLEWSYPRGRALGPGEEFLPVVHVVVREQGTEGPVWWVDCDPGTRAEARLALKTPAGRWERGTPMRSLVEVGRYFEDRERRVQEVNDAQDEAMR